MHHTWGQTPTDQWVEITPGRWRYRMPHGINISVLPVEAMSEYVRLLHGVPDEVQDGYWWEAHDILCHRVAKGHVPEVAGAKKHGYDVADLMNEVRPVYTGDEELSEEGQEICRQVLGWVPAPSK